MCVSTVTSVQTAPGCQGESWRVSQYGYCDGGTCLCLPKHDLQTVSQDSFRAVVHVEQWLATGTALFRIIYGHCEVPKTNFIFLYIIKIYVHDICTRTSDSAF